MTSKKNTAPKMTSHQIVELLRLKFAAPEWALFAEMRTMNGWAGGSGGPRTMDAWIMNTYQGKRFRTLSVEVKVSRSDFKREIKNPTKREQSEDLAGECFFAVPPGLVKPDEVPEGWGLMVAQKNGLVVKKHAKQRKVDMFHPRFVAALARRCSDPPSTRTIAGVMAGEAISGEELMAVMRREHPNILKAERERAVERHESNQSFHRDYDQDLLKFVKEKTGATSRYYLDMWMDKNVTKGTLTQNEVQELRHATKILNDVLKRSSST